MTDLSYFIFLTKKDMANFNIPPVIATGISNTFTITFTDDNFDDILNVFFDDIRITADSTTLITNGVEIECHTRMALENFSVKCDVIWYDVNGEEWTNSTEFIVYATQQTASITVRPDTLNLGGAEQTQTLFITLMNVDRLTLRATTVASWIFVQPTLLLTKDSATVDLRIQKNDSLNKSARATTVTISGKSTVDGTTITRSIPISQDVYTMATMSTEQQVFFGSEGYTQTQTLYCYHCQSAISATVTYDDEYTNWLKVNVQQTTAGKRIITFQASNFYDDEATRYATVKLIARSDINTAETLSLIISIEQNGISVDDEYAAWQDIDYTYSSSTDSTINYTLRVGKEDVFNGRAYINNGSTTIRVSDVARSYISNDPKLYYNDDYYVTDNQLFSPISLIINDRTTVISYYGRHDYSYDRWGDNAIQLNHYILNEVHQNQMFPITYCRHFGMTDLDVQFFRDGEATQHLYDITRGIHTLMIAPYNNINWKVGGNPLQHVKVTNKCYDYCLYYVNKHGGVDYMLFNLASKENDDIALSTATKKVYNNILPWDIEPAMQRAEDVYKSKITRKWTLKTNILNNTQSELFATHLLTATKAWLQPLDDTIIIPVVLESKQAEHKRLLNNNNKPIAYTITVREAYTRLG